MGEIGGLLEGNWTGRKRDHNVCGIYMGVNRFRGGYG